MLEFLDSKIKLRVLAELNLWKAGESNKKRLYNKKHYARVKGDYETYMVITIVCAYIEYKSKG